ncbi:MAG: proline--tRNA ligase [Candidatus Omnitrophota bacterium]|nr:proline--tRNA ligase [Candidatus Omnitrophota bacterium]
MKWSNAFIPTLKETPSDAEVVSHKLMLRAGLIRKLISGVYSYLPLGLKVIEKVKYIIRREMNSLGAQEVLLPALQPAKLWKDSGRYEEIGKVMINFIDRRNKQMILGPTHEEVITDLVKKDIKSYRQLPVVLYQIQTKFRDEPRPRFGVLRSCEFIMKDAYSFDKNTIGLNQNYSKMYDAYCAIFDRCGLKFVIVEADPGIMGGDMSCEFMVLADSGEDSILHCSKCGYGISQIAEAKSKHNCPKCKEGKFSLRQAIEIGHIFKLGIKYSKPLAATFLNEKGGITPVVMGCYGIGVNRIVAAAIEQNHDKDGIIWPLSISPYQAIILLVDVSQGPSREYANLLYDRLDGVRIDVLLDDRDERAGVKFKDADLIGIPLQLIISEKNLKSGQVEIKLRKTGEIIRVKKEDVIKKVKELLI